MDSLDWGIGPAEAWNAAADLAARLEHGEGLPRLETSLYLGDDEDLHASVQADCWWYGATDVEYEHRQFLILGSLGLLGITAAASAVGNRRRRAEAEALAAPQWRLLGCIPIWLTSQRLLLQLHGTWTSVWLSDLVQVLAEPAGSPLQLASEGRPPLAFTGQWGPYLAVALTYLTWSVVLELAPPVHQDIAPPPPPLISTQ